MKVSSKQINGLITYLDIEENGKVSKTQLKNNLTKYFED